MCQKIEEKKSTDVWDAKNNQQIEGDCRKEKKCQDQSMVISRDMIALLKDEKDHESLGMLPGSRLFLLRSQEAR